MALPTLDRDRLARSFAGTRSGGEVVLDASQPDGYRLERDPDVPVLLEGGGRVARAEIFRLRSLVGYSSARSRWSLSG